MPVHILTMSCPDRPGIVASVAQGLLDLGANILENAQFGEPSSDLFRMRTVFDAPEEDAAVVAAMIFLCSSSLAAASAAPFCAMVNDSG